MTAPTQECNWNCEVGDLNLSFLWTTTYGQETRGNPEKITLGGPNRTEAEHPESKFCPSRWGCFSDVTEVQTGLAGKRKQEQECRGDKDGQRKVFKPQWLIVSRLPFLFPPLLFDFPIVLFSNSRTELWKS